MKYEKPSVVVLADAAEAIQAGSKALQFVADSNPQITQQSNGAYEADE